MTQHKVWIEIEGGTPEEINERCRLLTNMMHRLGGDPDAKFYMGPKYLRYGTQHGFRDLIDRGEWFNLEYLGRDLDTPDTED